MNSDDSSQWSKFLLNEKEKEYYKNIESFLNEEILNNITVYPPKDLIFSALNYVNPSDLKVVIIGQDPYHGPNQANGFAFSVNPGVKIPASLRNIYKELKSDIPEFEIPNHGDLTEWANQGVLLLNTSLTVRHKNPGSHSKIGWEIFTDNLISFLDKELDNVIFVLWGSHAQTKCAKINREKHFIIESAHPSPFSAYRGFFGSKPFSKVNKKLRELNKEPINWNIKII